MTAHALTAPVASEVVRVVTTALVGALATALGWLMHQLSALLAASSGPQLNAGWFTARLATMKEVAVSAVLPLLLVSIGQAVWRQDGAGVLRAVGVQLPLAALGTLVLQAVAQALSNVVDTASNFVSAQAGFDPHNLSHVLMASGLSGALPPYVALLLGILSVVAVVLLWLEMLCRSGAISAVTLFMPLALAGLVWPVTAVWARRLVEVLAALIVSKLAIVAALSAGSFALTSSASGARAGQVGGGVALMAMAALAPFAILRMIPMLEGAAGLEGVARTMATRVADKRFWLDRGDLVGVEDLTTPAYEPPMAEGEEAPESFKQAWASAAAHAENNGSRPDSQQADGAAGEGPGHGGYPPPTPGGPTPGGPTPGWPSPGELFPTGDDEALPEGWSETEWEGEGG